MSIASGLVMTCLLWGQAPQPAQPPWPYRPVPQTIYQTQLNNLLPTELSGEQLQSLRSAIDDLQAAGLKELAQSLQQQLLSRTENLEKSLKSKQEQIARLQKEAQAIEDLLRPQITLQIQLQFWEIDREALAHQDSEPCRTLNRYLIQNTQPVLAIPLNSQKLSSTELQELVVHAAALKTATKVSTPKLITLNGQEAKVMFGGAIPLLSLPQPISEPLRLNLERLGTSITVVPKFRDAKDITCTWHVQHSSLNPGSDITQAAYSIPGTNSRQMTLTTHNHPGEFFVVGSPLPTSDSKSMIVFANIDVPTQPSERPGQQFAPQGGPAPQ